MKFCINCKYSTSDSALFFGHPNNGISLTTGKGRTEWARINRSGGCSKEGRWFEPKEIVLPKKPWYKFWSK